MGHIVDPAEPTFQRLERETQRIKAALATAGDAPTRRRLRAELRRARRKAWGEVARVRLRGVATPW